MTKPPAMPELPEPELGYIETDKSKQPAFSARQMRVALQSAQPAAAVSDADVWELWLRVCAESENLSTRVMIANFASAILALRPQAVPMMDEPFLKVHKGEICYKSDADDQSYGMWCPVNWDTEHGFSDGTVFYAHHGITQRADAAHQPAKEPR